MVHIENLKISPVYCTRIHFKDKSIHILMMSTHFFSKITLMKVYIINILSVFFAVKWGNGKKSKYFLKGSIAVVCHVFKKSMMNWLSVQCNVLWIFCLLIMIQKYRKVALQDLFKSFLFYLKVSLVPFFTCDTRGGIYFLRII